MISPMMQSMKETCIMQNKAVTGDGQGGYKITWTDGAEFDAWFALDTSTAGMVAEAQGVTSLYSLYVDKGVPITPFDAFRRKSDNYVFRVTSDGADSKTPPTAAINMRLVRAEKWVLPT